MLELELYNICDFLDEDIENAITTYKIKNFFYTLSYLYVDVIPSTSNYSELKRVVILK